MRSHAMQVSETYLPEGDDPPEAKHGRPKNTPPSATTVRRQNQGVPQDVILCAISIFFVLFPKRKAQSAPAVIHVTFTFCAASQGTLRYFQTIVLRPEWLPPVPALRQRKMTILRGGMYRPWQAACRSTCRFGSIRPAALIYSSAAKSFHPPYHSPYASL